MTLNEIIEKIKPVLADEFEVDPSVIVPDAALMETLSLDSLDLVDIVVLIERHFGITMSGPDFAGLKTFQDFYESILSKSK